MSLLLALINEDQTVSPPGILSAESVALPKVIQIVAVPGVPGEGTQSAPFVAMIVEPPSIVSAEVLGHAETAFVIRPAGIVSTERVNAGELSAGVSPPGVGTSEVLSPGDAGGGIRPPGIPPSGVTSSGDAESVIEPPGVPSVEEVAAGGVAPPPPPPPTPAHGGPGWQREQLWRQRWATEELGSWAVSDSVADEDSWGMPEASSNDVFVHGLPLNSDDDNVYVIPLRSFRNSPEPPRAFLDYFVPHNLERAAGGDPLPSVAASAGLHPLAWLALGAVGALVVAKVAARGKNGNGKIKKAIRRSAKSRTRRLP